MKANVALEQVQGVKVIESKKSTDNRGSFTKFFEADTYESMGLTPNFNSLAISENALKGTLRVLHFQVPPHEEEKLILCIEGRIYDVIVDLRPDSPTLGKWASIELDAGFPTTLMLPKGIAHGFQTLEADTKVFYGLGSQYVPASARSLLYSDLTLEIAWPLPISQISSKDEIGISLAESISLHSPEKK
jgi:dTDP-4-dehydrorhamnose 3,5-epimerase